MTFRGCANAGPNRHKALEVKREYFPRPTAFLLAPFLRGHGSGGEGTASATRLGYRQQARLRAPQAADEPHPTLPRTLAAPLRRARRLPEAFFLDRAGARPDTLPQRPPQGARGT